MEVKQRSDVLTAAEVAAELKCSPGLVRHLARTGRLPFTRITSGQRPLLRFLASDVAAYLDACNEDARA